MCLKSVLIPRRGRVHCRRSGDTTLPEGEVMPKKVNSSKRSYLPALSRSIAVLSLLVVVLVCIVSSPASGGGPSAAPSGTLKLLWPVELKPIMDVMIKNFENQYPNVNIQPSFVAAAAYPALLLTEFQAGTAPDVFWMNASPPQNVPALG